MDDKHNSTDGVKEDVAPTVLRPCQDDGYRHLWEDEQGWRFILASGVQGTSEHPAADALRWAGFGPEDNAAAGLGGNDVR